MRVVEVGSFSTNLQVFPDVLHVVWQEAEVFAAVSLFNKAGIHGWEVPSQNHEREFRLGGMDEQGKPGAHRPCCSWRTSSRR